jgi:hypothetical protein
MVITPRDVKITETLPDDDSAGIQSVRQATSRRTIVTKE